MTVQLSASTLLVHQAIARSREMPHVLSYFRIHNPGPNSEGWIFLEPQTPGSLMSVEWDPANNPAIEEPSRVFVANIPGHVGFVRLSGLDLATPCEMVRLQKTSVPLMIPVIQRGHVPSQLKRVDFTTIVLRPENGTGDDFIVSSFYPGAFPKLTPVFARETVVAVKTVGDVIKLGLFAHAKVVGK